MALVLPGSVAEVCAGAFEGKIVGVSAAVLAGCSCWNLKISARVLCWCSRSRRVRRAWVPDCGQRAITSKEGACWPHLWVRAILSSRSEFTGSQVMFLAGGDGVRLAGFECRIPRVGVGLIKLETKRKHGDHPYQCKRSCLHVSSAEKGCK